MKYIILILTIILLLSSQVGAVNKMYWASCRTGGGDCLDGIDGAGLTAGDGAIVAMDAGSTVPNTYIYRLYDDSAALNDPLVIRPATNAGTHSWHLTNMYGATMNTPTVDVADAIPTLVVGSGSITVTKNNTYIVCTAACQITPKAPAAGIQMCARNDNNTAAAITLVNLGSGKYYELTTRLAYGTNNYKLVSGGAKTDYELQQPPYDLSKWCLRGYLF